MLFDRCWFSGHFLGSVGVVLGFGVACAFSEGVEFKIAQLVPLLEENEWNWVECYLTLTTNSLYMGH